MSFGMRAILPEGSLVAIQPAVVTSVRVGTMQNDKKSPEQILHVIEDTLEERKVKERRKPHAADPFLNPSLERRRGGDRRDRKSKKAAQK